MTYIMATPNDLHRLEEKVDVLTDAVTKLVLFEERQSVQALAIKSLTDRLEATEQKLAMWINRGMGVWGVAAAAVAVYRVVGH